MSILRKKLPSHFWLAIAVTFVLLEVACFYGFNLLALNITYFAWIRACLQLSRMIAATNWTAARKFRASLS